MKSLLSLVLTVVIGVSPVLVFGQTATPTRDSQDQDDVIRVRSNEVRLDVVVKDKKGRPIRDLKAGDFEVLEDGVAQKVESFRFVSREAAPATTTADTTKSNTAAPRTPVTPTTSPRTTPAITALVFDRLAPEARALAKKAGLAYADEGMSNGGFTGVFGIDQQLRTVQPFTDNSQLVKDAVDRVTGSVVSTYASGGAKMRENVDRSIGLDQQMATLAGTAAAAGAAQNSSAAAAAGADIGQAAAQQKLLEMETQMLDHYERLERDQEGFATINSLLAVISPMQNLPGRKTIIFFSEGLKLPPAVMTKFPAVINAANRANVSIYAIDAAGLRIQSGLTEARNELNSIAAAGMAQQARGNDRGATGPYTRALERNEDLLRFDARSGLGSLADQTGGFLIHDTNDLVSGLRRIDDDMNGYYFLTYVPQNKDYDGRFRRISVKVSRSNVDIQSRHGYYAVESVGQLPMLDYEAPAIAAARNWKPGSGQNSLRSTALSYPVPGKNGLTLILAEARLADFNFAISNDNKTYNADFSVVALVRDETDQVVQKLSQHYNLTGTADAVQTAKKGEVLFYREAQLSPGKYQVELIAHDQATGNVHVSTSRLDVPGVDETRPRLSSVAVLKRAERITPEEQKQDRPLQFGELLVYPNLGERIDRVTAKQLAYFFTAWAPKGATKPMEVKLEVLQNNRSVGKTSGELPPPDTRGQIKYASSFPIDKLSPGVFELKITVSDGRNSTS
ncbi:MAG TPA: VWA domain-containing protein, partial [Pyrinomonadaceae bacterium]|nr:VWA domain-containing protein [Pyrinomonadaceae bacterium]